MDPGIRIVSYTPDRAASLADMWNRSHENWGGSGVVHTSESIRAEHENSINLDEFLAIDEMDEVIGFCSFSRYFKDEGALYIPLLNVRPDWHGRKTGKALVLTAVKRTADMGWPRLDLFTWPGNTKAVPMYKKCGFFWERRDDQTHLMNFIPAVLGTDLLKPFFETADWYADSTRTIELAPDGRDENGFQFYEYAWEHGRETARAEFEKTARGLRSIETKQFLAAIELEGHDLVAGGDYPVRFRFTNKTSEPMHVTVKGLNDGIVRFDDLMEADVTGTITLGSVFHLDALQEPQDKTRTHPAVTAEITINGRKGLFRMGVESLPPASLAFHVPHGESHDGMEQDAWMEIENHFTESAAFRLALPETAMLQVKPDAMDIVLGPGEKRLIPLRLLLRHAGFYDAAVACTASTASGGMFSFTRRITHLFKSRRGRLCGEDDDGWFIVNGRFSYHLLKNSGYGILHGFDHDESDTRFYHPSLGKPYSNEFASKRPDRVEQAVDDDAAQQRAWFASSDFPGISVAAVTRLSADGILKRHLEVLTHGAVSQPKPLWLTDCVYHSLRRAIIPYDGTFLRLSDSDEQSTEWFAFNRMTENWLFAEGEEFTSGLCWLPGSHAVFSDGMAFEHEIGCLERGEVWDSPPLTLSVGTYGDWKSFRGSALRKNNQDVIQASETLAVIVNDGNPFVSAGKPGEAFPVVLHEYKKAVLSGSVRAAMEGYPASESTWSSGDEPSEELRDAHIEVPLPFDALSPAPGSATLRIDIDRKDWSGTRKQQVFLITGPSVSVAEDLRDGCRILRAGNGPLVIEASPDFSHALFSLKANGREWLDSSFPKPRPNSWWNSWPGGIATKPWGLQHATAHAAGRTAEHAVFRDSCGNAWEGLSTAFTVTDHLRYKGLTLTQYFLLLPGVPVLAHFTRVLNKTGTCFNFEALSCNCFFQPSPDIRRAWFAATDASGNERRYRSGHVRHDVEDAERLYYGADDRPDILQAAADNRHGPHLGISEVGVTGYFKTLRVSAADGCEAMTDPVFLIAGNSPVPPRELADLSRIRFGNPVNALNKLHNRKEHGVFTVACW
jgi:ribosomal protein S18 acetylase RimI-like enzyme